MLANLATATGGPAIAALDGATLLGERAALNDFCIPGRVSAGGGCRLDEAADGVIALNLARAADRELLPAWLEDGTVDPWDDAAIAQQIAGRNATVLVARGREMGLAVAHQSASPPPSEEGLGWGRSARVAGLWDDQTGPTPTPSPRRRGLSPRVLDLSALWAGPLAAHLLRLAGADVIKVESPARRDTMRDGQPAFYDLLNQGKASVALDLRLAVDRAALLDLIAQADIVIEAARPRALLQLGIDADALVNANPALVWLTITAHGMAGEAANWVGFGDDVGVAAGLSAALYETTGTIGFVGDAIADPLTGIAAALAGYGAWATARGGRIGIAMRDVAADALAYERAHDPVALTIDLHAWAAAVGRPFRPVARRPARPARPFGGDPPRWSPRC